MAQLPIDEAFERFTANEERLDKFINDPVGYVATTDEPVESLPAFLERVQLAQSSGMVGYDTLANVVTDKDSIADRTVIKVMNDTAENNGYHRKVGGVGGSIVAANADEISALENHLLSSGVDESATARSIHENNLVFTGFQLSSGFGADVAISPTISGWAGAITYGGERIDIVRAYIIVSDENAEIEISLTVRDSSNFDSIVSRSLKKIIGSGWHTFVLSHILTDVLIASGVLYVGVEATDHEYAITQTDKTQSEGDIADIETYHAKYVASANANDLWSVGEPDYTRYIPTVELIDSLQDLVSSENIVRSDAAGLISNQIKHTQWTPPGGVSEIDGNAAYSLSKISGYFETVVEETIFNAVYGKIYCEDQTTDIEWKIFVRDTTAAFDASSVTPTLSGTIEAGDFAASSLGYKLQIDTVTVPAGKTVFVLFHAVNNAAIKFRYWYNLGIDSNRHKMLFKTTNNWGTFSFGTLGEYDQAGILLLSELLEFREDPPLDTTPVLVLPQAIYGLQSLETALYLDNVLLADYRSYHYQMLATGLSGTMMQQSERFKWIPAGALTSGGLILNVLDKSSGTKIAAGTVLLRAAAAAAGTGVTKKLIMVGDSLVEAGVITSTLLALAAADAMKLTLYGTRGSGANLHEGRGGWSIDTYTKDYSYGGLSNPFWISGSLDFPQYLTNNSIPEPDWVFIALGINDVAWQLDDPSAEAAAEVAFAKLDDLIDSIKLSGSVVKVGVVMPTPPSDSEDSAAANYALGSLTRNRMKRNILIWNRALNVWFGGKEADRIYIVPSHVNLDVVNNMSFAAAAPANSRSTTNIIRQNNLLHPGTPGYQQIADAQWSFLKYYA